MFASLNVFVTAPTKKSWAVSTVVVAVAYIVFLYALHGGSVGATTMPITVGMPSGSATICSPRFSDENVWPGYFYDIAPRAGQPTMAMPGILTKPDSHILAQDSDNAITQNPRRPL